IGTQNDTLFSEGAGQVTFHQLCGTKALADMVHLNYGNGMDATFFGSLQAADAEDTDLFGYLNPEMLSEIVEVEGNPIVRAEDTHRSWVAAQQLAKFRSAESCLLAVKDKSAAGSTIEKLGL